MSWIMEVLLWIGVPGDVIGWFVVLLDVAVKSVVILGVAAAVSLGLRGASAAVRHHVWAVALGGLLVLPLLSIVLPQWQVSFLPTLDRAGLRLEPVHEPVVGGVLAPDVVEPVPRFRGRF